MADPAPVAMPPGGLIEMVFTFDTTGSMYGVLDKVRDKVRDTIERLFTDIPALRIALVAHGDYCDAQNYVTKVMDFSQNVQALCEFVQTVGRTGGGDFAECYELVLRQCRQDLSWTAGAQHILVMIGDAIPHGKTEPQNKLKIDWKEEARLIHSELGVRIYSVQAHAIPVSRAFWRELASLTSGTHLFFSKMDDIVPMMMAICYREHDADFYQAYEHEVRTKEGAGISSHLNNVLQTLRKPPSAKSEAACSTAPGVKVSAKTKATPKAKVIQKVKTRPKIKPATVTKYSRARKATDFKKKRSVVAARHTLTKALKMSREDKEVRYTLGKTFREAVPHSRFALADLSWSAWRAALADKPPARDKDSWSPRPGHSSVGVRRTTLYPTTKCSALYEFAVQPEEGARKYPVYFCTTDGFNHHRWDTYLLRNQRIRKQVDQVLSRGCKLYVRRARVHQEDDKHSEMAMSSVAELRKLMHDTYDYAWDMKSRSSRREVIKRGKLISAPSVKIHS